MRQREGREPVDVEPYLPDLKAYLEGLDGLVAAWIYGSYGTPYQTPLSDLDLALLYRQERVPDFKTELTVYGRICEILREDDVSVTVLNRSPVIFQFRVLETGRQLVCRDSEVLADFIEGVLIRHADYIVFHDSSYGITTRPSRSATAVTLDMEKIRTKNAIAQRYFLR